MDTHHDTRTQIRIGATAVLGVVHLALAVLAAFRRLSYTVDPTYEILALVASNHSWLWIHGICAIFLFASLRYRSWGKEACAVSFGVMGAWSFFNFVWGMVPERPVSLAGPVLGFGIMMLAHGLVKAWVLAEQTHTGGK